MALELDDEHVYWTDRSSDGGLVRAPKSGGAPETLSPSDASWGIVFDGRQRAGTIYWTDWMGHEVRSVAASGGTSATLAATDEAPLALAQDEDNLYWLGSNKDGLISGVEPDVVVRMPKIGRARQVIASDPELGQLAVGHGWVVWTSLSGLYRLIASGDIETVYSAPAQALTIADDGWIYFSGGAYELAPTPIIYRMPLSGGAIEPIFDAGLRVSDIVVDDESIYFATGGQGRGYALWRIPKTGGDASCIASVRFYLGFLAVDERTLYWAEPLGAGIMVFDLHP